jgi:hypothetical protein
LEFDVRFAVFPGENPYFARPFKLAKANRRSLWKCAIILTLFVERNGKPSRQLCENRPIVSDPGPTPDFPSPSLKRETSLSLIQLEPFAETAP